MKRVIITVALTVAFLLVAGGARNGLFDAVSSRPAVAAVSTSAPRVDQNQIDKATESAYAIASPSVVYVNNIGNGTGSGVIYDSRGDIVTNAHVVDGAGTLRVTLSTGRTLPATLVGMDKADDLAVIHVNATGLPAARFANSHDVHVAQMVLAIGNPLNLKQSVTSGLVSATGRTEQESNGAYLPDAIQTSAPINPGNSGGALVALDGQVVGIPTLEATNTQNGGTAQGIGFAVPSSRVVDVANQLIASGQVAHTGRAYLGISVGSAGGQFSSPFDTGATTIQGAVVNGVSQSSPAGAAGLQQGDVVTAAGATPIASADDLLTVLAHSRPGSSLPLTVNRSGTTMHLTVKLGELKAS
ncbi:MAG: trypsin-like peptidase domain-containing protein [Chloroflexota bacterium]